MKKYNYFYYGTPITKSSFLKHVPENWEDYYDEIKGYSNGGFKAVEL